MTERWEQRLRDLHIDTPPDMWQRVQGGPRNEPSITLLPRRQRVTAAFVAVAIFVAAGLFAWQAFHPNATTVGSASPTPSPGMAVYTDPLGWTAVYPSDWSVTTLQQTSDGLGAGVTIANRGPGDKIPVDDVVVLTVTHALDATPDPSAGSSLFPLSPDDFKVLPGFSNSSLLQFKIDGVSYLATLRVGPAARSTDVAAMDDVIASIQPQSLPGTGNVAANPGTCPKQFSYTPWPGSDEQMVPGDPVMAVVCTYHPAASNPDRYLHPSRTVITGEGLHQLVGALNGLNGPPAHQCATQEALKEALYFSYGSATQLQVVAVLLGGCPIVQNGALEWEGARSSDVGPVLRASR